MLLPYVCLWVFSSSLPTGQVGLGVGSRPSNRATEGSNPKGTRLYFVILLKNVEKIFDWHLYNRLKDALMCRYILILVSSFFSSLPSFCRSAWFQPLWLCHQMDCLNT